ncbi:beta-lactamase-like protein [Nemania abortiva]|nr:beta-lactamase-like protein [Nemania abortiva]
MAPTIEIPPSHSTVSVSIIDTTSWARGIPCSDFFKPRFPGLDTMDICSYAFFISHEKLDRHVLFDLGIRNDLENLVPDMKENLKGVTAEVEKKLVDILRDGGVNLSKIEAAVWSHIHWDHTGNLADFPPPTELIVGPGIKERYMPGWPTVPEADFSEADVAGRLITGLEPDSFNLDVGGLRAHDYFGDGSFYLLDAPGHALGHMNALARTSADPATFIFLAADSVHLGGEIRPTKDLPLPNVIDVPNIVPRPCPADELLKIHPRGSRTLPYLGLDPSFPEDFEGAEATIEAVMRFDADDRVLVVFAHDVSMYGTVEFFPTKANEWKRKGWKSAGRWAFLADLQKIARDREVCVDSLPHGGP